MQAIISVKNLGDMVFDLFPEKAPVSVENFIRLANEGFYNGLSFHRVVKNYVIQGGSEDNTCMCSTDFTIRGEFAENGVDTGLSHPRGALSMARDDDYDSAGTQFFVVHQDAHQLDGRYAAFGMMTSGFDVLDMIAEVETAPPEQENRPLIFQEIETIRITDSR